MKSTYMIPILEENKNQNENFYIVNCCKNEFVNNNYSIQRIRKDWSILIVTEGKVVIKTENNKQTLLPNDVYIYKPNSVQSYTHLENCTTYWIHLKGSFVSHLFSALNIPKNKTSLSNVDDLIQLLNEIIIEYFTKQLHYNNIIESKAQLFLYILSRKINNDNNNNNKLLNDVVYNIYINPWITNEACARICATSKEHFIKIFKEAYSIPPHQFKKQILLNQAKNLLISTDIPITKLACNLGFENPSYFSHFFKNSTGIYPLQFRNNFKNEGRCGQKAEQEDSPAKEVCTQRKKKGRHWEP